MNNNMRFGAVIKSACNLKNVTPLKMATISDPVCDNINKIYD